MSVSVNNHSTTITIFDKTMPFDIFSAAYAIIVASGGIMGYVKAKSIPSLAAGLAFGTVIGVGSYLEATRDNYWTTFAASGVLGAMMTQRFLKSKKLMPSGIVAGLSIGFALRYLVRTIQIAREDGTIPKA